MREEFKLKEERKKKEGGWGEWTEREQIEAKKLGKTAKKKGGKKSC